ncbi:MAG: bifunctional oligoribonuclease/PAP phosphatase NrnA [Candidatus Uhrbacteria bacterium]
MESYTHRRIHDLLLKAKRPVFIADERIDGDSLGSSLAMADFLKGRGIRVPVFVSEPIPSKYRFLPNVDLCTTDATVLNDPSIDLVVSFDCSDAAYVARLLATCPARPTTINIDHHATNARYGQVNQVVVSSPATAEVVYRWFKENNVVPSREAATCLMTGICFDTTVFSNAGTNLRAFEAASELLMGGAKIQEVIRNMYQNRGVNVLRVWGAALERIRRHDSKSVVATFLTRADIDGNGATDDEVDGLSNFLNLVTESDVLFVMREMPNGEIKVSMRSSGPDVAKVAAAMGGGGHRKAAGFSVGGVACTEDGCWELVEKCVSMIES